MKIICVGRNYAEHAKELKNEVPKEPVIFLKPETAIIHKKMPFFIPDFSNDVHHEIELVVRINKLGKHIGMFADFEFDISDWVVPGKNVIVVKVNDDISEKKTDGDEIETVAITVEVTKDMLNSMAKGMYNEDAVGIWQDVKLIISEDVYIDNVFAKNVFKSELSAIPQNNTIMYKSRMKK